MWERYICAPEVKIWWIALREQSIISTADALVVKQAQKLVQVDALEILCNALQGGITCGAIDEPRKSSKAIDKRVIIDFRDKNVVIARFCDKNEVFI